MNNQLLPLFLNCSSGDLEKNQHLINSLLFLESLRMRVFLNQVVKILIANNSGMEKLKLGILLVSV